MNAGEAYSTLWTPVVNLARDPRWGRNVEVPGEDPFLTGEYAVEFIRGLQHEEGGFLQASACCKHFVANELEKTTQLDGEEWDRRHDNAQVTERDLLDSYFPPFEACVKAGVSGLMCSYNPCAGVLRQRLPRCHKGPGVLMVIYLTATRTATSTTRTNIQRRAPDAGATS